MNKATEGREGTELGGVEVSVPEFLSSCLEWDASECTSWPRCPLLLKDCSMGSRTPAGFCYFIVQGRLNLLSCEHAPSALDLTPQKHSIDTNACSFPHKLNKGIPLLFPGLGKAGYMAM